MLCGLQNPGERQDDGRGTSFSAELRRSRATVAPAALSLNTSMIQGITWLTHCESDHKLEVVCVIHCLWNNLERTGLVCRTSRSEERRVGKECRYWWATERLKKKR